MSKVQAKFSRHTHCRYCAGVLTQLESFSGDVCGKPSCRGRRLDDELVRYRDQSASVGGVHTPGRFPIVVVPHRDEWTVPVSDEERALLTAYLRELVVALEVEEIAAFSCQSETCSEEKAVAEPGSPDAAQGHQLEATVCGACQGYCCRHGASRFAFLDAETLTKVSRKNPKLPLRMLTAAYLSYVPALHYEESCIFHARKGCSLPRDMRATICNEYECGGLKTARQRCGNGRPEAIFIVARQDHRILQGTFASAAEGWVRVGRLGAASATPAVCFDESDVRRVE